MITQATTAPPVASPWVSLIEIREPPGVVYQDMSSELVLSVDLSIASAGVVPFTPARKAVLSSSRQPAMLISSMVPPDTYAARHTVGRAASQALSSRLSAAL